MKSCLTFVLVLLARAASAGEWFVGPTGNDAWSGRLAAPNAEKSDGPFATLPHARDILRKEKGARTVHIREGTYELPAGLQLGAEDGGTADAPVVWRAFEKEHPVLVGGRAIREWTPWKGDILQADLKAQGLAKPAFTQLLFAGERQVLARYPNFDPENPYGGGWAYADGEMWPMYADKPGEDKHTLLVKAQDWRTWAHPEDVQVFQFPRYNWWNDILPVKSVDTATRTTTTAKDGSYAMRANDRFYFQGALEELDAPGEWHLDQRTATVYFYPPRKLDGRAAYVPTTRDIIRVVDAQHLTLRGLTFECAEGSAILLSKTTACRVVGCTVRNVGDFGGTGISITGSDNGVSGCDISFTGRDGISLAGGDRMKLTEARNFAENCYIHHSGVFYKQGVGVSLSGVGQRVSRCLIHDTPRFGIGFTGNAHVLEYNHLRHLALETEDVGATYCGGRDWISPRGTVIRYNFSHDVLGYGWNGKWTSPYFAWGIYLDDNSGGVDVIGNIVARCGRSLMHGHSARDCRVENNVFIEGGMRQWEFNGWTIQTHFWETTLPQMVKGYESVVNEPAWRFMRGMQIHPADIPDAEGRVMSGNAFTRNVIAWKNPAAKALNVVAFNPDRNVFDHNLYWHHGQPLLTGQRTAGKAIGANLAPNGSLADGEPGTMPREWSWQIQPKGAHAALVDDGGRRALQVDAAVDEAKKRDNYPILTSREIPLQPGGSYRLRALLRTDRPAAKAALMLQFWRGPQNGEPAHFWASGPTAAAVTTEWKPFEFAFQVPARGERGFHEAMKTFRIRLDWAEKEGALFARDFELHETESMDEWQSWQALGGDRHSVIADPKFIAPEKDDYRLAPDSPAFALGFTQIPVEKIGPYASDERASWPIVEAAGAREHPLK